MSIFKCSIAIFTTVFANMPLPRVGSEGVRLSTFWVARIKILKDRWKLLSYTTWFLAVCAICQVISPFYAQDFSHFYRAACSPQHCEGAQANR